MLDKSIPFIDVLMHRPAGTPIPAFDLPEGYTFTYFRAGDEKDWAAIETSVLEFPSEIDALIHFQKHYLPYLPELERRCIFIETEQGEKVATATAFWNYTGVRRDPWLHWVAVKPSHQGLGLGKALVSRITQLMLEIEGDRDFYLHTQTWSHKAIRIYQRIGYRVTDAPLYKYTNAKYHDAIALLKQLSIDA